MAAAPDHDQETEQGFGTGLRRQLARRRDEAEAQAEQHPDVSKRPVEASAPAPPADEPPVVVEAEYVHVPDDDLAGELEVLRTDLSTAIAREREARDELADLQARLEEGFADAQSVSMRSEEVDARAAKIAAQQAALEEREQELAQRAEAAAAEQQRLADLKSELLAAEARTTAREQQISTKFRELQNADRDRTE